MASLPFLDWILWATTFRKLISHIGITGSEGQNGKIEPRPSGLRYTVSPTFRLPNEDKVAQPKPKPKRVRKPKKSVPANTTSAPLPLAAPAPNGTVATPLPASSIPINLEAPPSSSPTGKGDDVFMGAREGTGGLYLNDEMQADVDALREDLGFNQMEMELFLGAHPNESDIPLLPLLPSGNEAPFGSQSPLHSPSALGSVAPLLPPARPAGVGVEKSGRICGAAVGVLRVGLLPRDRHRTYRIRYGRIRGYVRPNNKFNPGSVGDPALGRLDTIRHP
ncbi:hypothetical protein C8R47DRAFT_1071670 [Mycena vitilis]|nr:hypothetical protein C8R47DRAFT_1071670 [Mycena vitilis]